MPVKSVYIVTDEDTHPLWLDESGVFWWGDSGKVTRFSSARAAKRAIQRTKKFRKDRRYTEFTVYEIWKLVPK